MVQKKKKNSENIKLNAEQKSANWGQKKWNTEPNRNREFIVNERGKELVVSAKDANCEQLSMILK